MGRQEGSSGRSITLAAMFAATALGCGGAPPPPPADGPAPRNAVTATPPIAPRPAPASAEIKYYDPWAPPKKVEIPPGWVEHRTANPNASTAYKWASILLEATGRDVDRTKNPRPTIIARQMAIPVTAMYDAWAAYDEHAVGTRLGGKLRRPPAERTTKNKEKAISYAVYRALVETFPDDKAWLGEQLRAMGYDPNDISTNPATPQGIGNLAAQAVLDFHRHDGANQFGDEVGSDGTSYSDWTFYEPRNSNDSNVAPDRWQPIPFDDGKGGKIYPGFLTPHWYRVKPSALERADQFRPPPQPKVGSPEMAREVEEVVAMNGGLSIEQKSIVEFMRDGPRSTGQSGHWLQFAQDVSRRDKLDLDQDVKLFFAIGNTAHDAFIACWDAKRFYDGARPYALVRVIRKYFVGKTVRGYLGPGKGFGAISAEQWHPYSPGTFVTPPFPGYVSGHSTVSGACSKMLELFTGNDRFGSYYRHTVGIYTEAKASVAEMQAVDGRQPSAGTLPEDKQVVLTMPTFTATADMAGMSRVMGGYHVQSDNVEGLRLGRRIAEFSWPKYKAYFDGTAKVAN